VCRQPRSEKWLSSWGLKRETWRSGLLGVALVVFLFVVFFPESVEGPDVRTVSDGQLAKLDRSCFRLGRFSEEGVRYTRKYCLKVFEQGLARKELAKIRLQKAY
jgi:hypothetical protein